MSELRCLSCFPCFVFLGHAMPLCPDKDTTKSHQDAATTRCPNKEKSHVPWITRNTYPSLSLYGGHSFVEEHFCSITKLHKWKGRSDLRLIKLICGKDPSETGHDTRLLNVYPPNNSINLYTWFFKMLGFNIYLKNRLNSKSWLPALL